MGDRAMRGTSMIAVERALASARAALLSERVVTLVLEGELSLDDLATMGDELFRLMHHGRKRVVIDLAEVSHIDYRGIKGLMARAELFRRSGGDIKVAGLSPYLKAIFRAGGAHATFEFYDTAEAAQNAFIPLRPSTLAS